MEARKLFFHLVHEYFDFFVLIFMIMCFLSAYILFPQNDFYARIIDMLIGAFLGIIRSLHNIVNGKIQEKKNKITDEEEVL